MTKRERPELALFAGAGTGMPADSSLPQRLAIIGICVGAAVAYGILHDQITARICIEYFTIGHPRMSPSDDPTTHAIIWGILATWWVGLGLGFALAVAATAGARPRRTTESLLRPIFIVLVVMAAGAAIAGAIGYLLATKGFVTLFGDLANRVPIDKHSAFIADLWAHNASYLMAFVGGASLVVRTWRSRGPDRREFEMANVESDL